MDIEEGSTILGTRGFSRVRREFSVLAEGRSYERRSSEKNLWHGALLFTVPFDIWAFLSGHNYTNQIESLQLRSCGPAREEMSKDPHYP